MGWPCDRCGRLVEETLPICSSCGAPRPVLSSPGVPGYQAPMGQRDLRMEAHLRAIALWYRILAVVIGLGCVLLIVMVAINGGRSSDVGVAASVSAVLCIIGGLLWLLGAFLGKFSNGARITAGVFTLLTVAGNLMSACNTLFSGSRHHHSSPGLSLFTTSLSLAWTGALAWALFNARSSEICTEGYRELVTRTPEQKPPTFSSPFFYLPFIAIGLGVALAILATFFVSRRRYY